MTEIELKAAAVKAANRMRDNHKEVCRVMMPHADELKLWNESTDRANVMARFVRSVIEPPDAVKEAMERLRKWLKAHNTQAKFDIYRGHKFGDRMGGLDYDALMAAYRHDLRILADWALSLTAPTPETTK